MAYSEFSDLILRKYFGVKRRILARVFPIGSHFHVLNEYPKSGGSWIGEMFAEALQIKYPRDGNNVLSPSLIHGHFMWPYGLDRAIVVWRDGRDVMTSSYFYYTRDLEPIKGHRPNNDLINRTRRALGIAAGEIAFSPFLRMMLTSPAYPKLSWQQYVEVWAPRSRCHHVKYEDFRHDPHGSLQKLVWAAAGSRLTDKRTEEIVQNQSFKRVSGREEGEENPSHFLRKGIVGDWKNHFSPDDERFFDQMAGRAMNMLGYDKA